MTSSLVGSEMCIRDRLFHCSQDAGLTAEDVSQLRRHWQLLVPVDCPPVSYTHLTLPTICSV
eukprot:12280869-Prorocentrum_lima.AAC.1